MQELGRNQIKRVAVVVGAAVCVKAPNCQVVPPTWCVVSCWPRIASSLQAWQRSSSEPAEKHDSNTTRVTQQQHTGSRISFDTHAC